MKKLRWSYVMIQRVMEKPDIKKLKQLAKQFRYDTVKTIWEVQSGHPGGSLSIIEILTVLYYAYLRVDPKNPKDALRDRFVLSKGHGSPALYVVLAELGFFPKELLKTMDKDGGKLPKHCNRLKTPGIEASTGALSQGFSIALGMALAAKLHKKPACASHADRHTCRVYAVLSDGECMEGQIWEAALTAVKYRCDNFIAIVDNNRMTLDDSIQNVMPNLNVPEMWRGFGWEVFVCDGHNIAELVDRVDKALQVKGKPSVLVANTIKGKGVSFMENNPDWHAAVITDELAAIALKELQDVSAG